MLKRETVYQVCIFSSFHASVIKFFDKSNFSLSLCNLQLSVETFISTCNIHTGMQTGNSA